jgi:hypothetical protein
MKPMSTSSHIARLVVFAGLGCLSIQPVAGDDLSAQKVDSRQNTSELGLDVFGLSLHANRGANYNEINPGLGLRYAFWHPVPSWTVFSDTGAYYDSRRHWAKYIALGAAYRWSPSWSLGMGLAYGQSETYHHGMPFLAPVPGIAFEYRRVIFNAVLLPSEKSNSKIAGIGFFATIPLWHGGGS